MPFPESCNCQSVHRTSAAPMLMFCIRFAVSAASVARSAGCSRDGNVGRKHFELGPRAALAFPILDIPTANAAAKVDVPSLSNG